MNYHLLLFKEKSIKIACLFTIIIILVAGLWPFNFWPQNEVSWLKDSVGVHFYGRGIIFSPPPANSSSPSLFSGGPLTIGLWLQPDTEPGSSLPRILSIYYVNDGEDFFIGQWKSELILRKRILNAQGKASYREVGVENALPQGQKRFIAITSDRQNTSVYVDGRLEKTLLNFTLTPKAGKKANRIILGNSPTGKEYWMGMLFGLAIYNDLLSPDMINQDFQNWISDKSPAISKSENPPIIFSFVESPGMIIKDHLKRHTLLMPNRFQIIQKVILEPLWKDFRWKFYYFEDIFLNIFGFIPFGFFTFARLRNKFKSNLGSSLLVVVLGVFFSLLIELIQVYLPSRDSQTMDVLTNTLGTYLGIILFRFKPILNPIQPFFKSSFL